MSEPTAATVLASFCTDLSWSALEAEVQALPWDRIPPKALAALRSLVAILPTTGRYPFSWQ